MDQNPLVPKLEILIGLVLLVVLIWFLVSVGEQPQRLIVTVTLDNATTAEQIDMLLELLDKNGATATFFTPSGWAEENPETLAKMATHELACTTDRRLALAETETVNEEVAACDDILENLTGRKVEGFKAKRNEISLDVYNAMDGRYLYSSSTYGRFGWFWEPAPPGIIEVPVTTVLLLPLDDRLGTQTLPLGDFFFYMARKARQETVVISLSADLAAGRALDVEYLLASYREKGVLITSIGDWTGSS